MISREILNKRLIWLKRTPGEQDDYGKPVDSFVPSGSTACCITSVRRENPAVVVSGGREIAYSHVLYCDPDLAISEDDVVVIDDRQYRIAHTFPAGGRDNHIRSGVVSVVL